MLSNDTFINGAATFGQVRLSQVSSSQSGISLNTATGAVTVAVGTPVGTYSLTYRICEILTPANCDAATVTVTVMPLQITATNDTAKGSSKVPNTALASVLSKLSRRESRDDVHRHALAGLADSRQQHDPSRPR